MERDYCLYIRIVKDQLCLYYGAKINCGGWEGSLMAAPEGPLWFLWDPFLFYVILVLLAPDVFYIVSWLIAPSRPSRVKRMAFESGQAPIRSAISTFPIEYFPYVIIYIAYAVVAVLVFFSLLAVIEVGVTPMTLMLLAVAAVVSVYVGTRLKVAGGKRG
jgi:NADH:ubiquinone oxidoreductase subunit 3 (subunit A)